MRFIDITGERYGRLTAIEYLKDIQKWFWSCDCGGTSVVRAVAVTKGHTSSCGCLHREKFTRRSHGMTGTGEYNSYNMAKARCTQKSNNEYFRYGAAGVKFLFNSFEEFFDEVGKKPSNKHSIDRINPCGNYEPGNVRWATPKEQANNKRANHDCPSCTQV